MAAVNPLKVSDLIHKYGWDIMVYLSNLGVNVLSESQILFVDGNHTNALNADDGEHGHSFVKPLATLNYAISLCTANAGDVILVAPNHTETIADTGSASGTATDELVIDVAGITIIGIGKNSARPTFTFNGATDAACVITAAQDITISNIIFAGGLEDIANLMTVDGTSDGLTLDNCEFRDGGTNVLETVHQINLATGADRVTINNCRFFTTSGGTSTLSNIEVATTVARLTITNCWFRGDVNTDGMIDGSGGAGSDIYIANNVLDNLDAATGKTLVLHGSTTGFVGHNTSHAANDGVNPYTIAGVVPIDNWYTNAEGARAALQGTTDDS
ncbi:hypothetical protein LCGC14_0579040 [marine sediment metagenome]|uniref:Right handed beta helix domain-containing protein n=1 Tax=marine sediment metagenome TaxID=412755 RepID=A0A0F9RGX8_9ZZZZ